MAKKKPATTLERIHMGKVAQLGCICCVQMGYGNTPPEIHHLVDSGRRKSHFAVIPLCAEHHRIGQHGPARHKNKTEFEETFGDEQHLLMLTMQAVKSLEAMTV